MKKELTLMVTALAISFSSAIGQSSLKIISNGNVGVSTDNPIEKLQVNGAINIGNTNTNIPGSIRWTGSDFEGFDGVDWKSLTKCNCEMSEEESNSSSNPNTENDNGSDDNSDHSDDNSSDADASGCQNASSISTADKSQKSGWTNQLNTDGLGFTGEGEICYTISSYEGNTTQMIGLSDNADADAAYENINYAFYHRIASTLNSHRVYVWENNERKGIFLNSSDNYEGTTFCIRRNDNSEVEYYIDNELVYTSETRSDEPLYFDNSFYGFSAGSSSIWNHQPSNIQITDISVCSDDLAGLTQSETETSNLQQAGIGILQQNVPNPFIDQSQIGYNLSGEIYMNAELVISNSTGQIISKQKLKAESGQIKINRESLSKGVYQYTVFLDGVVMETKKMVVN